MKKTFLLTISLAVFAVSFYVSFAVSSVTLNAQSSLLAQAEPESQVLQAVDEIEVESEETEDATDSAVAEEESVIRPDLTQQTEATVEPLVELLNGQTLGHPALNPFKYAIRASVEAGVPANTIVLLLMIPAVTALIAAARQLVGIRGFGIFLPAVLSVVFVAIGPLVGLGLFLVIVAFSTFIRIFLRRAKIKLQYLPRMSLILLFSVLGVLMVLFLAPVIKSSYITNVSIFPVLILVLLAEEFSKVQLGKSAKTAVNLTTETLILSLFSYIFLTLKPVQEYALLNPEIFIISVATVDYLLGKYVGLRFIEFWKFRKLISG